jgi:hypothetical protein
MAVVLLLAQGVTRAQQKGVAASSTLLAVERVDDDMPGMQIQAVNSPDGGSLETGRFHRVSEWKPPAGGALVSRLKIRAFAEGDAVRIKVLVIFDDSEPIDKPGPKYGAREQPVADYLAREGETVTVRELARFGVEPLVLRVVKARPLPEEQPLAAPPEIENRLKSVEVISLTPDPASPNGYKLALRNLTQKNIVALEVYESEGGKRGGLSQTVMQFMPGRALIAPGAIFETRLGTGGTPGRWTPQGFVPDPARLLTFAVGTIVFDDGTYEGEPSVAANIEAGQVGLRLQRKRMLSLLNQITDAPGLDVKATLEKLKSQVAALRIDVDEAVLNKLLARYPSLSEERHRKRLMSEIMSGLKNGRQELLSRIGEFERAEGRIEFGKWLGGIKEQYAEMTIEH